MREPFGKMRDLGSNITQKVAILQMKIILLRRGGGGKDKLKP
jgi:hypothetical protein